MINYIVRKYLEKQYKDVENFINHPIRTQKEVFNTLLKAGQQTLIGREHNFDSIKNQDDFRKNVPVFKYEDTRKYLDAILIDKQSDVLWNKPIKWFAMSSGTTEDRSKYIPVTSESLQKGHYRCGEQMLAIYAHNNPKTQLFSGKTLVLGGSKQINNIGNSIFTGDISAILIKNLGFFPRQARTPERISLLPDWEEKLEALKQYVLTHDIRALMGVPSWMMVLLKKIKEETGREISDICPNLEVFFHGGVSFTPFENPYKQLITKPNMNYWETYNASEGFFGVQYSSNSKDMLLMLDSGIYYEFVPANEWDKEKPSTLTLDEVETGVNYAILITTNGGLWRYMIGDTIQFTSTSPYLFKITGRTKNFINAFGEEIIIDNAEKALKDACLQTNAEIAEYTAGPIYFGSESAGAHEWLIEFEKEPCDLQLFKNVLDETLRKVNSDYDAKRSYNLSLMSPVVKNLPKGTFYEWMKAKNKIGGQNKVPRLANNRDHLDSILNFLSNTNK